MPGRPRSLAGMPALPLGPATGSVLDVLPTLASAVASVTSALPGLLWLIIPYLIAKGFFGK